MKSPDDDNIEAGETVLDDGAKILDSQVPGKAVSVGPLQVVFFQQD